MGIETSIQINKKVADWWNDLLEIDNQSRMSKANHHLFKRGIGEEDIIKWQLGYSPLEWSSTIDMLKGFGYTNEQILEAGISCKTKVGTYIDRFRNRIMFPIKNIEGDIVGFTGRAIEEYENDYKVAKYLNSSDSELFNKSQAIFGIEKAIHSIPKKGCVIIMEGQFDVITAHKHGITNSVACSGTALTEAHLNILKEYTNSIVLCFDNDEAGAKATVKALTLGTSISLNMEVVEYHGSDPDEALRENSESFNACYAKSANDYIISKFITERDSRFLMDYLYKIKSKQQDNFLNRLNQCI
jgi:DNA primase